MNGYVTTEEARGSRAGDARSKVAREMLAWLMGVHRDIRREALAGLTDRDRTALFTASEVELGTPYGLWHDSPVAFVEDVLRETLWAKQKEVLNALVLPDVTRIAVPAGFGLGKTHLAGKATCWFGAVHPVGTATVVTTATRMRQVEKQLWPHVRKTVARAALFGDCGVAMWKVPDRHGVDTTIAYGFTAPAHDEAAMQGIHAPKLLLIVDEAGGIDRAVGRSTRNLLTGDARMLAIGNPATDDEASWFESLCGDGDDPEREDTVTVKIAATDSPAVTGEDSGPCRDCPAGVAPHPISDHLVDSVWIADAIRDHGEDAPYVVAKVHANFPKGGSSRAIPSSYVEVGVEALLLQVPDPEDAVEGTPSLDRKQQPYPQQPHQGAWIRLGVDVAADGGDEFVISRAEGDLVRTRLVQSGAANHNPTDVAGKVLEEIRLAEALAEAVGSERKVRVKVDAIGVGWGVVGILEAWGKEGLHDAEIVRVVVSENPDRPDDPRAQWRPKNKRAEMWLNGRALLTPDPAGRVALRLDIDPRTAAQLRAPEYGTDASGRQVIETKDAMKRRGVTSPDRAEALLLAVYEPKLRRGARLLA